MKSSPGGVFAINYKPLCTNIPLVELQTVEKKQPLKPPLGTFMGMRSLHIAYSAFSKADNGPVGAKLHCTASICARKTRGEVAA